MRERTGPKEAVGAEECVKEPVQRRRSRVAGRTPPTMTASAKLDFCEGSSRSMKAHSITATVIGVQARNTMMVSTFVAPSAFMFE